MNVNRGKMTAAAFLCDQQRLFPAFYLHSCINSRYEALSGCFLISGASVKLSAAEKALDLFEFQCGIELARIDAVQ